MVAPAVSPLPSGERSDCEAIRVRGFGPIESPWPLTPPLSNRSRIYPTSVMFGGEVGQARLRVGRGSAPNVWHGFASISLGAALAGAAHEARRARHDLEFLFPRDRGDRARLLQAAGPRGGARADLPGRQGLRGAARWRRRSGRRIGAFGARGLSAVARRQAPLRAGAGHVLVPGDAQG